tara:strand:+ start:117 stop:296 length:180 start_codon:yes stop_codon:yes gene_type:complete
MSIFQKFNLNLILISPLAILCLQWLYGGRYLAFILSLVFAFVLYGVIEPSKSSASEEEE